MAFEYLQTTGGGSAFNQTYVGKVDVQKTSATTGSVTLIAGSDADGNTFVISNEVYSGSSAQFRVTFPSSFPSSVIATVCAIDTSSGNHFTWGVICFGYGSNYIDISIGNNDGGWGVGTVGLTFIAYSIQV